MHLGTTSPFKKINKWKNADSVLGADKSGGLGKSYLNKTANPHLSASKKDDYANLYKPQNRYSQSKGSKSINTSTQHPAAQNPRSTSEISRKTQNRNGVSSKSQNPSRAKYANNHTRESINADGPDGDPFNNADQINPIDATTRAGGQFTGTQRSNNHGLSGSGNDCFQSSTYDGLGKGNLNKTYAGNMRNLPKLGGRGGMDWLPGANMGIEAAYKKNNSRGDRLKITQKPMFN